MKRFIAALIILLLASPVFAASTATYVEHDGGSVYQLNVTHTCGAGSAVFTNTKIPYNLRGMFLYMIRTYPGATATTDASDFYLYQHASNGKDILDGGGVDKLDATSTLTFQPLINGSEAGVPVTGDLWFYAENNSVNAAIVTIELHFIRLK